MYPCECRFMDGSTAYTHYPVFQFVYIIVVVFVSLVSLPCNMRINFSIFMHTTNIQIRHELEKHLYLLPTGSEKRGVLGVGSIPVAILPSSQYMKLLHHNCKAINIVG